jgi:hypothetical protein
VRTVDAAGQSLTVSAQLMMVETWVSKIVDVVNEVGAGGVAGGLVSPPVGIVEFAGKGGTTGVDSLDSEVVDAGVSGVAAGVVEASDSAGVVAGVVAGSVGLVVE